MSPATYGLITMSFFFICYCLDIIMYLKVGSNRTNPRSVPANITTSSTNGPSHGGQITCTAHSRPLFLHQLVSFPIPTPEPSQPRQPPHLRGEQPLPLRPHRMQLPVLSAPQGCSRRVPGHRSERIRQRIHICPLGAGLSGWGKYGRVTAVLALK